FNRMYLSITERIAAIVTDQIDADPRVFADTATMAELDVRFANFWLAACDAAALQRPLPSAWRPLFDARGGGRMPIQYAISGMNSHIEHDLPIAVVETCAARGLEPDDLHRDFEAVNNVLAQVESQVRRSFLSEVGREVDD